MNRWDEITRRLPKNEKIVGVEIGVWQGDNAVKLLEMNPNLFLILIDKWENDSNYITSSDGKSKLTKEDFDEAKKITIQKIAPYNKRTAIIEKSSNDAVKYITSLLDFLFIDANHNYESVKEDIELWLPHIKWGGFISGHDYGVYPGVKLAVDEIFDNVELGNDYTWFKRL